MFLTTADAFPSALEEEMVCAVDQAGQGVCVGRCEIGLRSVRDQHAGRGAMAAAWRMRVRRKQGWAFVCSDNRGFADW